MENELTRTNQLLNSLYTEFAASKELFRKDTVLTKQSLAALTIQHIETEKRIGALTDDHSATKQTLKRTQTELDHTTEELANVKRELEHEKERHRQSRIIPPTETTVVTSQPAVSGVAFFATMNAHPENLGINQIVEFPKTITNEGNAWDSRTSTFKAPRAGLYYFSASIMSHLGEDIETELVRNGVGLIYSYDGDKGTLGVRSLSGVLKLQTGDDVWIRIYNNPNVNAGNVRVYGYEYPMSEVQIKMTGNIIKVSINKLNNLQDCPIYVFRIVEYASTKELLYSFTEDYVLTKEKLAALTTEHASTKEELAALSKEHAATKPNLAALSTEHAATKQSLAALTTEYDSTREELTALTIMHTDTKNRLSVVTDDHCITNRILHTTRTDLDKASNELVKVKRALAHEKERNRQSRIILPTAIAVTTSKPVRQSVAFFAVMTDHQQNLGIHQTVGFQKTVTNVGNGWDGQANVFRAPKAGLYYFSATIMAHSAEDIETELVLKGVPIVYSFDRDKSTHGVGTLSAVLNLALGDDVWIRIYNNLSVNNGNVRVFGFGWSWFSGFLISE
ncbi:Hypothetical predicted protein [Mytilus galloprovincialis]|uniref:C1q domain-containing protein n=1 Tax=Mytilus galloprovincialis TaxID=29158 RepID=A0A8B6EBD0_MYTGA|nr:Hypothetical predicted protein [Mytilus galloprovincialis]